MLGAGKLGEALVSGMLRKGRMPQDVRITVRRPERGKLLEERYGVRAVSTAEAAATSDVLLVTVKPQDVDVLVADLAPHLAAGTLVISLAAGIPTAYYEKRLAPGIPVVRVMTNTPVLVDEAMSAISPGSHAEERHLVLTEQLLRPVGAVVRVPESQQDAVTALSGSGPAYFFYLVEAMTAAGILLGLPRAVAADPRAGEARCPGRVPGGDRGRPRPQLRIGAAAPVAAARGPPPGRMVTVRQHGAAERGIAEATPAPLGCFQHVRVCRPSVGKPAARHVH